MRNLLKLLFTIGTVCLVLTGCHNYNIKSPKQIRNYLVPRTVWVGVPGSGHGSGSVINYHGKRYIATNAHVCNIAFNHKDIYIKSNLKEKLYKVEIVTVDRRHDICLTTVPHEFRTYGLKLGMQPHEGDDVYVLGFPYSNRKTFVFGEYTGEQTIKVPYDYSKEDCPIDITEVRSIFGLVKVCKLSMVSGEITATIYPGNSGSAVVNNRGLMVGIIFAGDRVSTVTNYMIPVRFLRELLKTLEK